MKRFIYILIFSTLFILSACQSNKEEITISAAASLTDAMEEIISLFEDANPDITVAINLGGSGSLSQQITHGAPVDIFFSASLSHFEKIEEQGLINEQMKTPLLTNKLVWIQQKGENPATEISDLNSIAIGTPETVPAGRYAKQALMNQGLYSSVKEKLIFTKDVRQVAQYVEGGNVEAGLVYQTDAFLSDDIKINKGLPIGEHDPIIYPVGVLHRSKVKVSAEKFYHFLQTEEATTIFEKYGFHKADED